MITRLRAEPLRALVILEWLGVSLSFAIDLVLATMHLTMKATDRASLAVYVGAFVITAACVMTYPHTPNRRYVALVVAVVGIEILSASPVAAIAPIVMLLIFGARLTFAYGLRGTLWTWVLGFASILVTSLYAQFTHPVTHPAIQSAAYIAVMTLLLTLLFGLIGIMWLYHSKAAETAAATERSRIALDLHDSLGHTLTTLSVHLQNAKRLRTKDPHKADRYVERAGAITTQLLGDLRDTVAMLHDNLQVEQLPASPLLARLRADFESAHDMALRWSVTFEREPSGRTAITIYRFVQEALTNVVRHANARSVSVSIHGTPSNIGLIIQDDGNGFDVASAAGHGLVSMRNRIESASGEISISSTPGSGTRVQAKIPVESVK